jgi:hypothetical protein
MIVMQLFRQIYWDTVYVTTTISDSITDTE